MSKVQMFLSKVLNSSQKTGTVHSRWQQQGVGQAGLRASGTDGCNLQNLHRVSLQVVLCLLYTVANRPATNAAAAACMGSKQR